MNSVSIPPLERPDQNWRKKEVDASHLCQVTLSQYH